MLNARREMNLTSRFFRVFGVGESNVETILLDLFHSRNPTLALYCGAGEVTARLTASGAPGEDLSPLLGPVGGGDPQEAGRRGLRRGPRRVDGVRGHGAAA